MREKEARRAIRELAVREGVTEKKIIADIEEMIHTPLEEIHQRGDLASYYYLIKIFNFIR